MNRPAAVTASAVILAVLSLFQIAGALAMALAASFVHAHGAAEGGGLLPSWTSLLLWVLCGYFVLAAAWGISTAIGLHRLRRWARYSILIIGGLIAVFAFLLMVGGFVAFIAPQLSAAGAGSSQLHSAERLVRLVLALLELVYAGVCAIGVWWLVYFNRKPVREAFASSTQPESANQPMIDQPQ